MPRKRKPASFLRSHKLWDEDDYAELSEKGRSDREIKEFWDRDAKQPPSIPADESTDLRATIQQPVLVSAERLERIYRAACVLDDRGFGNEMVDEILIALTPLISPQRREQIESEVKSDPESGLEGG